MNLLFTQSSLSQLLKMVPSVPIGRQNEEGSLMVLELPAWKLPKLSMILRPSGPASRT